DAPRPGQPAIVVDRDLAGLEVDVALLDPVAATVEPGAAGGGDGRVAVDAERVVRLEVLGRDVLEERPPRVAVHAVADRTAGNTAVEDLHRVENLALSVPAGIEHVRARPVALGGVHPVRLLHEFALELVELTRER